MKLLYHIIFILTVSLGLPFMLIARDKEELGGSKDHFTVQYTPVLIDSISSGQDELYQEDPKGKRSKGGKSDQPGRQKPTIKEVPRSIPKLKPKTVTDRIPIKRPPLKIPKKGIEHLRF